MPLWCLLFYLMKGQSMNETKEKDMVQEEQIPYIKRNIDGAETTCSPKERG